MRILAILGLLFLAPLATAGADLPPTEEFLPAFVRGDAHYEIQAKFHEKYPNSPHRRGAEEYEAAVHCLFADDRLGEEGRQALTDTFLARLKEEGLGEEEEARILFVVARLRRPAAVPALVARVADPREEIRDAAIGGLACFGTRPDYDGHLVFGGRFVTVLYPPEPDSRATKALLARARQKFDGRVESALESHDTPEVLALARERKSEGLLRALLRWRPLDELVPIAREDPLPEARHAAVRALGRTRAKEAIAPLIDLLGDDDSRVRVLARQSLGKLAGERAPSDEEPVDDPEKERGRWRLVFGPDFRHFAPEKAWAPWPTKPGIYR